MMIFVVPVTFGEDSSRMKANAGNGASSKSGYMIHHGFCCKPETTKIMGLVLSYKD